MTKKEKALLACEALEKIYPDVECSLNSVSYTHLIMQILAVKNL